jgi:N-acyl homoserine lactone hydrolase
VTSVRRIDFGYFVRPASETGTGGPRVEPCLGYLVEHDDGLLLFDTGMGSHPEADVHYRPRRRPLREAVGVDLDDITLVANCHLHFDHCGGNPSLGHAPVIVQRIELDTARSTEDYTLPELLEGVTYEEVHGAAEVLPGVQVLPTPGHTNGHQSLVVRCPDGTVILAGQSHDTTTAFAADALAARARREGHGEPLPVPPAWVETLLALDPARVVFAHDASVWVP